MNLDKLTSKCCNSILVESSEYIVTSFGLEVPIYKCKKCRKEMNRSDVVESR